MPSEFKKIVRVNLKVTQCVGFEEVSFKQHARELNKWLGHKY